jgi:hypothetical protein
MVKKAWKRLARDGIRTIGLIILCNFICMSAAATNVVDGASDYFFIIDWLITSTLLIHHYLDMAAAAHTSHVSLEMQTFAMDSHRHESIETTSHFLGSNITYRSRPPSTTYRID